jgi:L-aminopeptidase/D-esterase-like protein
VQCNYGRRREFQVAGVPVGEEIPDQTPCLSLPGVEPRSGLAPCADAAAPPSRDEGQGSIIVVVATDAPLLPHQLKRVVTRVALGVGKMGGYGGNSSGDIFVAFSTANARSYGDSGIVRVEMVPNARMNPLFYATVQATEEAIINALLAAETMTGINDFRVHALPVDRLRSAMAKYGRPLNP